jgi:hypothetical protein
MDWCGRWTENHGSAPAPGAIIHRGEDGISETLARQMTRMDEQDRADRESRNG